MKNSARGKRKRPEGFSPKHASSLESRRRCSTRGENNDQDFQTCLRDRLKQLLSDLAQEDRYGYFSAPVDITQVSRCQESCVHLSCSSWSRLVSTPLPPAVYDTIV